MECRYDRMSRYIINISMSRYIGSMKYITIYRSPYMSGYIGSSMSVMNYILCSSMPRYIV